MALYYQRKGELEQRFAYKHSFLLIPFVSILYLFIEWIW